MTSVFFDPNLGGDGTTVSDDADPNTGLRRGGYQLRFVPALQNTVSIAGVAKTNAQTAVNSASTATTAASQAQAALDEFTDLYLGSFAVDPVTDNDGDPLQQGAIYFNTVTNTLSIYTGTIWIQAAGAQATFKRFDFTTAEGQTAFDISPDIYIPQFLQVYLDGVLLLDSDYVATDGSTITLASPAVLGQTLSVLRLDSLELGRIADVIDIGEATPNSALSFANNGDATFAFNLFGTGLTLSGSAVLGNGVEDTVTASGNVILSSGNLGVGIENPQSKVHVNMATASPARIQLTNTTSGTGVGDGGLINHDGLNLRVINQENGTLALATNGLDRLSISNVGTVSLTGNLIIGDAGTDSITFNSAVWSAPNGFAIDTSKLVLNSAGNLGLGVVPSVWEGSTKAIQVSTGASFYGLTNYQARMGANHYYGTGGIFRYISSNFASDYQQFNGIHTWLTAPSGTAGQPITFTQAMTLTNTGNLLVGTAVDVEKLTVNGNIRLGSVAQGQDQNANFSLTTGGQLIIHANNGDTNNLSFSALVLSSGTTLNPTGLVTFTTNNLERARITSAGNLLVGTTLDSGARLRVGVGGIDSRGGGSVDSNTSIGLNALASNTTGVNNTASGFQALQNNTSGSSNTATGVNALLSNTSGNDNTATGVDALLSNTTGNSNSAFGRNALRTNTTGFRNTSNGVNSLISNTIGTDNTASGSDALRDNTTGVENTAIGSSALLSNTTGSNNTANGLNALLSNTTGNDNTAGGIDALRTNTTGVNNTASGAGALKSNTIGIDNTANGVQALQSNTTGVANTASGAGGLQNNTTGVNNFAIGFISGADAVRNITTQSNEGVLGNDSTVAIYAKVALTVTSDVRDKTEITSVPLGLSFVEAVNPISYRFKESRDKNIAKGRVHLGFSAQELLDLQGATQIVDDSDSENLKLNKDDLIAVLFNAVKELSDKVKTLEAKLGE